MNTPLPLDEAAVNRVLGRSFIPGRETIEALAYQSRAALTLRARVAELERELNGVREASASELSTAYKRVAELEQESLRYYAADGSFVEMESAEAVVAARIEAAKRVAELEGELARAKWDVSARNAHANALRDALKFTQKCTGCAMCSANATVALASTPAADLAAYRKSVLLALADELDDLPRDGTAWCEADQGTWNTIERIRALAAQEVKP